jgi:hypothetical protein
MEKDMVARLFLPSSERKKEKNGFDGLTTIGWYVLCVRSPDRKLEISGLDYGPLLQPTF